MNTVGSLVQFMKHLAPLSLAEDWDNTGLLVGDVATKVNRVMTCLTVTETVVKEAVDQNIDMIVSHHPLMFRATKKITTDSSEGRMLLGLIKNDISVYSPHTAFDSCALGINQRLAEHLGLQEIQSLRPSIVAGLPGSGRWGKLTGDLKLSAFLRQVKQAVAADYIEVCGNLDAVVSGVAVACGSAGEFLTDAIRHGCDTFITGEARFHSALEAQSSHVNLIVVGHYESERPAVEWLAKKIATDLTDLEVKVSECEENPLWLYS